MAVDCLGNLFSPLVLLMSGLMLMDLSKVDGGRISRRDIFSTQESVLDMALSSFDDQYKGCSDVMEAEIPPLFDMEYSMSKDFAEAWDAATVKWEERKKMVVVPSGFKDKYAIALFAYTNNGPLHKVFNADVREAGRSRQYYLKNFKFKAFHYYLTKALQVLDAVETPVCHKVFRGIRGFRFKSASQKPIRFGQFTSSSLNDQSALQFGEDTFFSIQTCYGVNIRNFSFYPGEEEVLIPPFEKFKVTNFTKDRDKSLINLRSVEASSVYNCEFVKERRCTSKFCPFNSAISTRTALSAPEVIALSLIITLIANPLGSLLLTT
ncbi:hypothetical protein FKM82_019539 [Ascaphus truei]